MADLDIQEALAGFVLPPVGALAGVGQGASAAIDEDYAHAERDFANGDISAAADRLAPLQRLTGAPEVSLALAICAARLERYDDAEALALASLDGAPRSPRALCLIGICALLKGRKSEAQARLALAARLARGHEEFREDMRSAQKLLLLRYYV